MTSETASTTCSEAPWRALSAGFFDRDANVVARALLGKVIRRRWRGRWLSARIIETEAYAKREKGSHASLGRTPSREALFMAPGTIYMYYARGGDSLNVSCRGEGDAVLIKSAYPWLDTRSHEPALSTMQRLNPSPSGDGVRPRAKLCAGQTLLCRALALRVPEWNGRAFDPSRFFIEDVGESPAGVVRARRLGIPEGRDEHLLWRWVDAGYAGQCTSNPLTKRTWTEGEQWRWVRRPR